MPTSSAITESAGETPFLRARPSEENARNSPTGPKKNDAMIAAIASGSTGSGLHGHRQLGSPPSTAGPPAAVVAPGRHGRLLARSGR